MREGRLEEGERVRETTMERKERKQRGGGEATDPQRRLQLLLVSRVFTLYKLEREENIV